MESNSTTKLQEYKENLLETAEELIFEGFPKKILQLNEMLDSDMFCDSKFKDVHQDLTIPVPGPVDDAVAVSDDAASNATTSTATTSAAGCKRPRESSDVPESNDTCLSPAVVPCNAALCEMLKVVKPIIKKFVEDSNTLKMWIAFLIPKIDSGNNFGVSIQVETQSEIEAMGKEAAEFFEQIFTYFFTRARLVTQVSKYPKIEDYRRTIVELDEKEYLTLALLVCEVRNRYSSLHDLLTKNLEKLKKPRSSCYEELY